MLALVIMPNMIGLILLSDEGVEEDYSFNVAPKLVYDAITKLLK